MSQYTNISKFHAGMEIFDNHELREIIHIAFEQLSIFGSEPEFDWLFFLFPCIDIFALLVYVSLLRLRGLQLQWCIDGRSTGCWAEFDARSVLRIGTCEITIGRMRIAQKRRNKVTYRRCASFRAS